MRTLFIGSILLALTTLAQPVFAQTALTGTVTSTEEDAWKASSYLPNETGPIKS
jgi:hypothetical protein